MASMDRHTAFCMLPVPSTYSCLLSSNDCMSSAASRELVGRQVGRDRRNAGKKECVPSLKRTNRRGSPAPGDIRITLRERVKERFARESLLT